MGKRKTVILATILIAGLFIVSPFALAADACASDKRNVIDEAYKQALLDLQTIPDDAAIAIYCDAFDASYANGVFDPILFERSFSDSVSSYLSGNPPQSLMTIQDTPMSSAVTLQSSSNGGGVTKVETYNWGIRVYLSATDQNAVVTGGSGATAILLAILKAATPVGIAVTLASMIVSLLLNYADYDGIVFDIRMYNMMDVLGYALKVPINPPRIENIHEQ